MNQYCLDRQELSAFLEKEFKLPIISASPHIDTVIEQWENWEICLHCTATLLSQVLENKQKYGIDVYKILEGIYKFSDSRGLFTIEQIDEKFLDFMFDNIRNPGLEIEDNLIQIKQELNERKY
jgi:hypothetical protein